MSLGAGLVADDRTILTKTPDGPPIASAPDVIRGLIEAYGVGVLRVEPAPPASLVAVADLGEIEAERIPPRRTTRLIDWELDLFHKPETGPFHDVLFLYLTGKACLT
jgi:HPr kinase/phosphorylase